MLEIGKYNILEAEREMPQGLYLGDGKDEVLLPNKYIPKSAKIGSKIKVFVYTDSLDRPVATTLTPKGIVGDFVCLKVVDTTKYGAFMDWGLEKDLFVPFRQMIETMKKGNKYVVRICFDDVSDRIVGVGKLRPFLKNDKCDLTAGDKVSIMICLSSPNPVLAIINNKYHGILQTGDNNPEVYIGSKLNAYINKITDDKKISLSLFPTFTDIKEDLSIQVIKKLKTNKGFLSYHDKSSPEDIQKTFNMSKKSFKKTIGLLYKSKIIVIKNDGIYLKD